MRFGWKSVLASREHVVSSCREVIFTAILDIVDSELWICWERPGK